MASSYVLHSGASAVDGAAARTSASESFAALIAGTGNYSQGNPVRMQLKATTTTDLWSDLWRGIFLFDPSPLPPGSIITGGSLSLYVNTITARSFSSSFVLTNAPVASYTTIASGDYDLLHDQPVEHGTARVLLSSLSAGSRFSLTLNSTAITTFNSLFDSGNVFELGLMFDWDFDGTSPTWSSGASDDLEITSSESGAANWPILTLEYYVRGGYATLEITGTKASAGDTLKATLMVAEVFSGS